jgi:hypothetical protein
MIIPGQLTASEILARRKIYGDLENVAYGFGFFAFDLDCGQYFGLSLIDKPLSYLS